MIIRYSTRVITLLVIIVSFVPVVYAVTEDVNKIPEGFESLFNGKDLTGWHIHRGLPPSNIGGKWYIEEGVLIGIQDPPGKGGFLTTTRRFKDFEMRLQTKIDWPFDSGVFLRVSASGKSHQVTLDYNPRGEIGGIYCPWTQGFVQHCKEGKKYFKKDAWNDLKIICEGEPARIRVFLNDRKITDFQHTEETTKDIPPAGTICLQIHPGGVGYEKSKARFRNIYIKELAGGKSLFNGKDLTGWEQIGGKGKSFFVEDGILVTKGKNHGWLCSAEQYEDFKLELEFRTESGANSGVFIRTPRDGNPAYAGMEIQVIDDHADEFANLKPWQFTGSIYGIQPPAERATKKAGQWQNMQITCRGQKVQVKINNTLVVDTDLKEHQDKAKKHPGINRKKGYIGLQSHGTTVEFRNIRITKLIEEICDEQKR